jgi:hypothetical protein
LNWEAIAAISEAAGALAILVSLIYVGVQIRQSTQQFSRSIEARQLAAFERNIESGNRVRELLLLHPELADLMLRGFDSQDNLQDLEKFRFSLLIRNIFSSMQGGYIRHLALDHDPEAFVGGTRILDELLANPGVREWLESYEPDWRSEFRALVDARLEATMIQETDADPGVEPNS